ncbi:hypothetical protein RRSWK_00923 [Rhodopirellula sp. SWK7]|nr:hypothetical protein RRSWK_00923 [Rhodopirellula sp. SWK7]
MGKQLIRRREKSDRTQRRDVDERSVADDGKGRVTDRDEWHTAVERDDQ